MKTNISASWSILSVQDVALAQEYISGYKKKLQLRFQTIADIHEFAWAFVGDYSEYISSIWLPGRINCAEFKKEAEFLHSLLGVSLFVGEDVCELSEIVSYVKKQNKFIFCISQVGFNSIFEMVAFYGIDMKTKSFGLSLDLSRLPEAFCDFRIIEGLLPFIKIVVASNRVGEKLYLPIFGTKGELKIVGILTRIGRVKKLLLPEITLRFGKEYRKNLVNELFWLEGDFNAKRAKFKKGEKK